MTKSRSTLLFLLATAGCAGCVTAGCATAGCATAGCATSVRGSSGGRATNPNHLLVDVHAQGANTGTDSPALAEGLLTPPVARREPRVFELHGHKRVDEYSWLHKKGEKPVLEYLRAENEYAARVMRPTEPLQAALYGEMLARVQEADLSVPYSEKGYFYYTRTEAKKAYPIHCRKKGSLEATEEVLLDLNELGAHEKFVASGELTTSEDGKLLAYTVDTVGFRQYVLRFKNLATGEVLQESVERVTGVRFAKDGRTALYVVEDPVSKRSHRLYRHVLGTHPSKDALVYDERDERFDLDLNVSRSGEFFVVTSQSKTTTEVRTIPTNRATESPKIFSPREAGHRYFVDHARGQFLVRTDSGGALNFRLCTATKADTRKAAWKEVVPHREEVMLEGVVPFESFVILYERQDGLPRFTVSTPDFAKTSRLELPQSVYSAEPGVNREYTATTFRFEYESPTEPPSVYEYDPKHGGRTLLKRTPVLGGFDSSRYETERVHAVAPDGTKIPISLVYRKDLRPGTPKPTLLYGYGSYGLPLDDGFSSARLSLLDRGLVFAVAHVRGGGELGKRWHDQGRMLSKMNTFHDFIAAAEHLKRSGVTAKGRLAITGGSAGGLLVGAVTNMRPDLFDVVVSVVPFVDVLNTMLDESLPLTVSEFEEWGDPKVKEFYEYMAKYSPYDNLVAGSYPTMLVKTSYHDSQVMYWEPAKYVARLRALKTNDAPLLLRTELEGAGHGGPSDRYARLKDAAFDYAFLIRYLNLPTVPASYPGPAQ